MHTFARFTLVLSMAATAAAMLGGCAAASNNTLPEEEADDTSSYPLIDGSARTFKPGPPLATPSDIARTQRLDYHRKVIAAHGFSYTIDAIAPTQRTLANLTGYRQTSTGTKPKNKKNDPNLPATWDWRGKGVPEVRDQGNCGSCWAFGTAAVVESAIGIFGKQSVNLSEQLVVDCNQNYFSCNGGDWSFEMFMNPEGGALESSYPYTGYDQYCQSKNVKQAHMIEGYQQLDNPSIDQMKRAIYDHGVVGVSMSVCGSFPGFNGGVYDSSECDYEQRNHIVNLVGWDDSVAHSKGKGVWILRNSWGTWWGDKGYGLIAYDTAAIGADLTYASVSGSGGGVPDGGGPDDSVPDDSVPDDNVPDDSVPDDNVPDEGGDSGPCGHSPCEAGSPLDWQCGLPIAGLCWVDEYCCTDAWDEVCVAEYSLFSKCP